MNLTPEQQQQLASITPEQKRQALITAAVLSMVYATVAFLGGWWVFVLFAALFLVGALLT